MGKPLAIKTDNGSAYLSGKCQHFFQQFDIKHITGIPGNSTGQAIIERQNRTLKEMLQKLKGGEELVSGQIPR